MDGGGGGGGGGGGRGGGEEGRGGGGGENTLQSCYSRRTQILDRNSTHEVHVTLRLTKKCACDYQGYLSSAHVTIMDSRENWSTAIKSTFCHVALTIARACGADMTTRNGITLHRSNSHTHTQLTPVAWLPAG